KFNDLKQTKKVIEEVKGIGLMIGVKLGVEDASSVANECMKKGLLINCTQKNILRIMPPMTITKEDIDLAMEKITEAMETL
ncbi:aminotransferase class III-fold pyridoxal phosphate-dependent enzyme, partial [Candidatus Omnitrophota bacterium]